MTTTTVSQHVPGSLPTEGSAISVDGHQGLRRAARSRGGGSPAAAPAETMTNLPRDELAAAVATRRELGPDYEPALIEGFVERVSQQIDARVDARLAERGVKKRSGDRDRMWLALGSIVFGTPITAVAGGIAGVVGVVVAWVAIALINVAYNLGHIRRSHS